MDKEIWILASLAAGVLEEETLGLAAEARRLRDARGSGLVAALVPGGLPEEELSVLGASGVDRVMLLEGPAFQRYDGEAWARELEGLARDRNPVLILMIHKALTEDLAPRLAAALETGFLSRAVDLLAEPDGRFFGVRPIANGHLYEEAAFAGQGPGLVSFIPSVLASPASGSGALPEILRVTSPFSEEQPRARVVAVMEADPESAALEDAEIIVAGGRGIGQGEAFDMISALARALGGSVAGTRPVIDWETLPFERQIGQTGKTVAPRLMIACGISGANEFTAGMEKSRQVIAVNTDPRARIFRFADLGVVGDARQILPGLIERIEKEKHAVEER
jgi:electron transfer flavoprotein alpha subunit